MKSDCLSKVISSVPSDAAIWQWHGYEKPCFM